jgi:hypothetical protein
MPTPSGLQVQSWQTLDRPSTSMRSCFSKIRATDELLRPNLGRNDDQKTQGELRLKRFNVFDFKIQKVADLFRVGLDAIFIDDVNYI